MHKRKCYDTHKNFEYHSRNATGRASQTYPTTSYVQKLPDTDNFRQ